ncbi:MAG: hypothetical protein WDM81_09740 [Rhizomicrobium sp.]
MSFDIANGKNFIRTPLSYPGGNSVVVQVGESERDFFVSDFGMGLEEAELMGATPSTFSRYANAIAESTGTRFDNHSFFIMEASREQLAGAIVAVANASQAAVMHTAFRMADRTGQTDGMLFARLEVAFKGREAKVIRDPQIIGHSSTPWRVDALVRTGRHQSIFESVSKHPASIAAASTKFHDIALNDNAPRRFAVVRSKLELGTYLNVLSQAASVIEETIANETIVKLAEAA